MPKPSSTPPKHGRPHRLAPILGDDIPPLTPTQGNRSREIHDRTTEWEQRSPKKHTVALSNWVARLFDVLAHHDVNDEFRTAPSSAQSRRPLSCDESVEIRQLRIYTEELKGWSLALDQEIGDTIMGASFVEIRLENLKKIDNTISSAAQYLSVRQTLFFELRAEHDILEDLTSKLMERAEAEQTLAVREGRQAKRLSETFRADVAPHLTPEQEGHWVRRVETPQPTADERSA